jgi:two-component system, sporulation sensor kinase E
MVLDSLGEGIIAFDANRKAVVANSHAADLIGWDGKVEGVGAASLFENIPELLELVERAFDEDDSLAQKDAVIQSKGNISLHMRVITSVTQFEDDPGIVLILRDASDVKRVEREIYQADKMTALGRLAASVAHEVRNPLGAMTLQLQLLEEDAVDMPAPDRARLLRRLNIANAEIKRLDRIVGNFLRFSRPSQVRRERLSLNDVVRRVFDLVTPEAREQEVNLVLDLAKDLPPVEGDEGQLAQAVLNITVNAFHAIQKLAIDRAVEGEFRATTRLDPGHMVRLTIQDDGEGIPEVDLDRVFEFYFTTKDEGTGLGLSIAQRIIYEHGGSIDVESVLGEGTTFIIILPALAEGIGDSAIG